MGGRATIRRMVALGTAGAIALAAAGCSSAHRTATTTTTTAARRPAMTLPPRTSLAPATTTTTTGPGTTTTSGRPASTTTRPAPVVTTTTAPLVATAVHVALITTPGPDQLTQTRNYFAWMTLPATGEAVTTGRLTVVGIPDSLCARPIPSGAGGGAPAGIPFGTVSILCSWVVGITDPTSPEVPSLGPWTAVYLPGPGYAASSAHS